MQEVLFKLTNDDFLSLQIAADAANLTAEDYAKEVLLKYLERRASHGEDWIREAIIAEKNRQQLTSYAIAKLTDNSPNEEAIQRFIKRRCSLKTSNASAIADALGMTTIHKSTSTRKKS